MKMNPSKYDLDSADHLIGLLSKVLLFTVDDTRKQTGGGDFVGRDLN